MGTTDSRGIYTPAADEDGWDDEMATNLGLLGTIGEITAAVTTHAAATNAFSKGCAWYDATVVPVTNIMVWRAPFACTATALRGFRVGGTGATLQAYRWTSGTIPGTAVVATSTLSLSSTTAWNSTTTLTTTAFSAGDTLIIGVLSVTGSPTQITGQVDFTRP